MSTLFQSKPREIIFTVEGRPRSKGSMKPVWNKKLGRTIMVAYKTEKPWTNAVKAAAAALGVESFRKGEPVEISLNFYFSLPRTVRRTAVTVKPDVDKCIRLIFDALKGVLLYDDSQVIEVHARKHYGGPERVEISIQEAIP